MWATNISGRKQVMIAYLNVFRFIFSTRHRKYFFLYFLALQKFSINWILNCTLIHPSFLRKERRAQLFEFDLYINQLIDFFQRIFYSKAFQGMLLQHLLSCGNRSVETIISHPALPMTNCRQSFEDSTLIIKILNLCLIFFLIKKTLKVIQVFW